MNGLKRIPSLELQTMAFMDAARSSATPQQIRLSRNGFRVCLDFEPELSVPGVGDVQGALAISDVYVPARCRHRGWFTHYWQFCRLLAGGTVFIDDLVHLPLRENLLRHGFREVVPEVMMLGK